MGIDFSNQLSAQPIQILIGVSTNISQYPKVYFQQILKIYIRDLDFKNTSSIIKTASLLLNIIE